MPLSTIGHWKSEIKKWTDFEVAVLDCHKHDRKVFFQFAWQWPSGAYKFDILLTTYDIIKTESTFHSTQRVRWEVLILDEGHRIKNSKSVGFQTLMSLKTSKKLVLTGTPLQNNLEELWCLLHFLHKDRFPDLDKFMETYKNIEDPHVLRKLQTLLKQHMLRRNKHDLTEISKMEEILIELELTQIQKQYYRGFLERNREFFHRHQGLARTVIAEMFFFLLNLQILCFQLL